VTRIEQMPIPVLSATSTASQAGQTVTFDASKSSRPFGSIIDYRWDLDGSGAFATDTGTVPTVSHVFATPGTFSVAVRLTGSSGDTATTSATVKVTPAPPSAQITAPGNGKSYALRESVPTSFSCSEGTGGPGLASCKDSNGANAPTGKLDTSTYGQHTYTVTAVSSDGQKAPRPSATPFRHRRLRQAGSAS
jgi:PKD domain-containing protein